MNIKQLFIVLIFLTSCAIYGMRETTSMTPQEYDDLVETLKKESTSYGGAKNNILAHYIPLWQKEIKENKRSVHPLSCAVARLEDDIQEPCLYYPHSRKKAPKNLFECLNKHFQKKHVRFFSKINPSGSKTKSHTRSAPTPTRSKKLRSSFKTADEESKEESAIETLSKEIDTLSRSISQINHTIETIKEEQSRMNTALKDFKTEFDQKYAIWETLPTDGF